MLKLLQNPHIQTIVPALFTHETFAYRRETISTLDEDFLDLDFAHEGKERLVICMHGLESDSQDTGIRRCIKFLSKNNFSVLIPNMRGCSGRANKHFPKSYHSGKTEDLDTIIKHVSSSYQYSEIYLIGFSVGGNIVLKYLGEEGIKINPLIKKAIAISPPINLQSCAEALARPEARIYMRHFLDKLGKKLGQNLSKLKTFYEYDTLYTAPLNGFKDAYDYWTQASSKPLLEKIGIPTLMITALDDPFFGPECFISEAEIQNKYFKIYTPEHGGHLGFMDLNFYFENLLPRISIEFSLRDRILDFLIQ